jgi:hypothetical protein
VATGATAALDWPAQGIVLLYAEVRTPSVVDEVSVLFPKAKVVVGQMKAGVAELRIVKVNALELIP